VLSTSGWWVVGRIQPLSLASLVPESGGGAVAERRHEGAAQGDAVEASADGDAVGFVGSSAGEERNSAGTGSNNRLSSGWWAACAGSDAHRL
jgi:hypothetical protein